MPGKVKRTRLNWFLVLRLTGIVIFVIILTRVDVSSIVEHIGDVRITWLLAAILFQLILLFVKAIRWHLLNNGSPDRISIYQSFGEFFESYAIGVITPGRLGELLKAGYAKKKSSVIGSGINVLVERGFDLGIFLMVAGIALAYGNIRDIGTYWGWLIIFIGLSGVTIATGLMTFRPVFVMVNKILLKFRIIKKEDAVVFDKKTIPVNLTIVILSIISNLSAFISCFCLAIGIYLSANFIKVSGGIAIAGMLNLLPITVMGLGTRDLTFLYIFGDLPGSQVLAFSGLVFLVVQIGGGLIALIFGQSYLSLARKGSKSKQNNDG
jgi:uncharacterized protein (TIRG00374 family)